MKLTTFNARIETIATSRTYAEALQQRRCAIFADGYYEWHKEADESKTPVWIYRKDREPFVFAGLWETWRSRELDERAAKLHDHHTAAERVRRAHPFANARRS